MATPRKRWLRVHDEVADKPWSNEVLATFVRLQCHMNTKWARNGLSRDAACRPCLTAPMAFQITAKMRLDAAFALLRRTGDAAGFVCTRRGDVIEIDWPNYAELQELPPDRGAGAASDLPSPQTPPLPKTQTQIREEGFLKVEEIGGKEAIGYGDRSAPSRFQHSGRRSRSSGAGAQRAQAAAAEREREKVEMIVVLTPVKEINFEFRAARLARGVSDPDGRAALEAVAREEAGDASTWASNSGELAARVRSRLRDFGRAEWGSPS